MEKEIFSKFFNRLYLNIMNITQALELAIKNGWKHWEGNQNCSFQVDHWFLDKDFWIALGKGMGWKKTDIIKTCLSHTPTERAIWEWELQWHRFLDVLIEGGDFNSYFEKL